MGSIKRKREDFSSDSEIRWWIMFAVMLSALPNIGSKFYPRLLAGRNDVGIQFNNIDELCKYNAGSFEENHVVLVLGRNRAGDGGGGLFRWSPNSVDAADGGRIYASLDAQGRWLRLDSSGRVDVRWYGASAGGKPGANAAAINRALSTGMPVYLPNGCFNVDTSLVGSPQHDYMLVGQDTFEGYTKNAGENHVTGSVLNWVGRVDEHVIAPWNTSQMNKILLSNIEVQVPPAMTTSAIYIVGAPPYITEYGAGVNLRNIRASVRDYSSISLSDRKAVGIEIDLGDSRTAFGWRFEGVYMFGFETGIKINATHGWFNGNAIRDVLMYQVWRAAKLVASPQDPIYQISGNYFSNWQVQSARDGFNTATGVISLEGHVVKNTWSNLTVWDIVGSGTMVEHANRPSNWVNDNIFIGAAPDSNLVQGGQWTATIFPLTSGRIACARINVGRFYKVGRQVTVTGRFVVTDVEGAVGQLELRGLPFKVGEGNEYCGSVSIAGSGIHTQDGTQIAGFVIPGTNSIRLVHVQTGDFTYDLASRVKVGTEFTISATYFTN
ncbi:MAG: hypothetical protein Q7N50_11355 [Armatimonadota bacterium]|nr:hypothetical protein [Armatimonadota bacterium]